jgi:redox-sensitive bicupin YhaK (pirin superfamily)
MPINGTIIVRVMKNILRIYRKPEGHWVGDGFPVHTVLDYQRHPELSPFLLLDHFGPADFPPAETPRGVGWHPHRGFETVTVLLEGEVEHEDTAGNGGRIGPGEVQWMTAGAGLLHKEFHSEAMTRRGGRFHGLQLWVNLPARFKMTPPRYQTLTARDIPIVDGVRVIAGEFRGVKGPAQTFTPINLLLVSLKAGDALELDLGDDCSAALYVAEGKIVANAEAVGAGELAVFDRKGSQGAITAQTDAIVFVMNGAPIDEPIAGYGPFVMNTSREIQQAFADYHAGRLGTIPTQEKTA